MSTATAQVYTLPEREFRQAIADMLGRGEYDRVLEAVRSARTKDPKNIFLIGIDRQVRRLQELIDGSDPEVEERGKTEESLSQLVQRAWADATTRGIVLTLPADPGPAPAPPVTVPAPAPADPVQKKVTAPAAAPAEPPGSATRFSGSMALAAVLTVAVIGMAITYFVHRRGASREQAPVVVMSSEPHVDPVTIAGDPPTPKVESVPAPAPPEVKRERNVRDDARARIQTPAPTEEKAAHPTVQEMPKSLPPAEKQKPADVATPTQSSPSAGPVAQTATESPEPFIPVQQEPRVVKLADPELGDVAMKYGSTGEVVARVLIGTDGKAMKVRIVKSTNKFLNKPVAEALLRSSFEPGVMTAGPVQSWLTVPFKFR